MVLLLAAVVLLIGSWAIYNIRVDAIPDLSDVQVIIFTDYPGQAPQVVEDQVTYPLTTSMLAVPYAKVVRGYSFFGFSFVYIIFEDGTDLYWARSRVLEYLNYVAGRLPKGVTPQIGPDATGVGWVYEYSLRNGYYCPEHPNGMYHHPDHPEQWYASPLDAPEELRSELDVQRVFDHGGPCPWDPDTELVLAEFDLSELRSLQDWYLRYELTAVEGVAEVAGVGGFVRQYQVVVDPDRLLAYEVPLEHVKMAIQRSNNDVGGRVLEMSETEYMVRGLGYLANLTPEEIEQAREAGIPLMRARADKGLEDLEKVVIRATETGTPVYLGDVADVHLGPELRRGLAEANGEGEVAGGIVVMRFGDNALQVIRNVKDKLNELKQGLPPGVDIVSEYDRSALIERAIATLTDTLIEEMIVVAVVCIIFLLHARSSLVAAFVLPTGVLVSLIIMHLMGINANIMSLGGIAISIGVMVDSSVVMVENAHKHLAAEAERVKEELASGGKPVARPQWEIITESAKEVGPTLFFSLLIITVSFLPVFALGEQSGRMFKPLAFTKTFSIAAASFLAITIIPVLMILFIKDRQLPKEWGWKKNGAITLLTIIVPAVLIFFVPLEGLDDYRVWLAVGWMVLAGLVLIPQRIISEENNPLSRILQWIYTPLFNVAMRIRWGMILLAITLAMSSLLPLMGAANLPRIGPKLVKLWPALDNVFPGMGREFMPPLEEGDLLYMPTTDPGISITKARELLQQTDALIMTFPEVHHVFGKIGRAETATDPAPLSMVETTIMLEQDKTKWRQRDVERWHDFMPDWLTRYTGVQTLFPNQRPITTDELTYGWEEDGEHVPGLNDVVSFPGLTNAWTMPIKTRIDMLATGIKTPVGIKIMGDDLGVLADIAEQIATQVRTLPGTLSAYPEKAVGGNYVDFEINRDEVARYGLKVGDVQDVILSALGGMNITSTVEGLERYPVNLRYKRELRDNIPALKRTLVWTPSGAQVPLAQLADIRIHKGPPSIKSENARKTAWIYVDLTTSDVGGWVDNARHHVAQNVTLPAGYNLTWSGQYEYMQEAAKRMQIVVPITAVVIILILYISTRSWFRTILTVVTFTYTLSGSIWFLYLLDYNLSMAVYIGMIALAGLDAETNLVMLLYLDNTVDKYKSKGRMKNLTDLKDAIYEGAVLRIRPKTMTVATTFLALVPLMWAEGTGADTMRRLAAPMIGGLFTSFVGELLIFPGIFFVYKRFEMWREHRQAKAVHA
ncbi:MAG: cation transporter [Phycisphaerae bacterium]